MQKISREQSMKRFQILSDTLQDLIFSETTAANIRKASVLGDIEEKVTALAEMVGLVLMGFLNPADFENELQKELGIEPAVAKQIANQINAEIFSLVQTELRKLYPPSIKTPTVLSPSFAPASVQGYGETKPNMIKPIELTAKPQPIFTPPQLSGFTAKLATPAKEEPIKTPASEFEKRFFKPAFVPPQRDITETLSTKPINEEPKKLIPVAEDFIAPSAPISAPSPAKIQTPIQEQSKEISQTKIAPVIPLPTYIQSQFQKRSGNVIDLRNKH